MVPAQVHAPWTLSTWAPGAWCTLSSPLKATSLPAVQEHNTRAWVKAGSKAFRETSGEAGRTRGGGRGAQARSGPRVRGHWSEMPGPGLRLARLQMESSADLGQWSHLAGVTLLSAEAVKSPGGSLQEFAPASPEVTVTEMGNGTVVKDGRDAGSQSPRARPARMAVSSAPHTGTCLQKHGEQRRLKITGRQS